MIKYKFVIICVLLDNISEKISLLVTDGRLDVWWHVTQSCRCSLHGQAATAILWWLFKSLIVKRVYFNLSLSDVFLFNSNVVRHAFNMFFFEAD